MILGELLVYPDQKVDFDIDIPFGKNPRSPKIGFILAVLPKISGVLGYKYDGSRSTKCLSGMT